MSKRIQSLDLVRSIAILLICFNHSISTFYVDQINSNLFNNISTASKLFMTTSYILSRIGVPLFLLLTGALILNKKFSDKNSINAFYKNNLLTLLISVELWNFIYYFINLYITNTSFNLGTLLKILTFTENSVYGHMWYMPMILGMYIFLPFVSLVVQKYKLKELSVPILLVIVNYFILNYLNSIFGIANINFEFNFLINLAFSGAQYGIYIILGYYIFHEKAFQKINNFYLILISLICFIASCLLQIYLWKNNASLIVYYNFIGILISSICVFILLIKLDIKNHPIVTYLSKNSLAIYFIHFPILIILKNVISLNLSRPLLVWMFYILSLIISILLNELFKRFNFSRKYLLRIKNY